MHLVPSETHGLQAIPNTAKHIYSVGISTAGNAEMHMALEDSGRHITATTISKDDAAYARKVFIANGLQDRVDVRLENVSRALPYSTHYFDFIYARLILHYLSKQELGAALGELYRILKPGEQLYVIVRSQDCPDFDNPSTYDETSGITTYSAPAPYNPHIRIPVQRYFHTKKTMTQYLKEAGFDVGYVLQYNEQLCIDFQRTTPALAVDNLIEVLATKPDM